jgi:predicted nucleic acid-binding protein
MIMKVIVIVSFILAILSALLACSAIGCSELIREELNARESELKREIQNLREAIRVHAIDKDLHKTSKTKEK